MKLGLFGNPKFIGSVNLGTDQKKVLDVPPGRYNGFLVVATGTNDTDDDYTFADNANNAIFRLNNNDLVNLPLGFLADFVNLEHGTPGNSSTTAGAFSQSAIVPLMAKGHENAVHVRSNDVALLTLDFGTIADIASGTAEVYALESDFATLYLPRFYDFSMTVASGKTTEQIQSSNLIEIYAKPASTNLDSLRMEQDGKTVYDITYTAAKVLANVQNQVETALTYANIVFADKSLSEGLGAKAELIADGSGSDTLYVYVFAFDGDVNRYRDSVADIRSKLERKAVLSSQSGNADTVNVIRSAPASKEMMQRSLV